MNGTVKFRIGDTVYHKTKVNRASGPASLSETRGLWLCLVGRVAVARHARSTRSGRRERVSGRKDRAGTQKLV
jgi:hypothetical protein